MALIAGGGEADHLPLVFGGQEKSLLVGFIFRWVTVTVPPPVSGTRRQFVFACASVLAPGIQSGSRYSGLADETGPASGPSC